MNDRLTEELTSKYKGKKVKDDCTDCLDDEELLSENGLADEDDEDSQEITENMEIHVEIDDNECITGVFVYFRTFCHPDSGLGEEDPEYYWDYDECLEAAEEFVDNILEEE